MTDKNFVVKNGLVVNTQFTVNSVSINHSTFLSGNATSFNVGSPLYANNSAGITANNLLIQGDGTNATIKPTNSGSALSIGSNNTTQITVASNGNIGISNNIPTDKLSVAGSAYLNGNLTLGSVSVPVGISANGGYGTAGQVLTTNGSAVYWSQGGISGSNTQIQFNDSNFANGSAGFTFNKTSNALFVGNSFTINGNSSIGGGQTIGGALTVGTNTVTFGTTSYFVSNGNVGIQTNTPGYTLTVNGSIFGNSNIYANNLLLQGDGTNAWIRPTNSGSALSIGSNNINQILIAANGNIGISNTTPAYAFSVTGSISVSNATTTGLLGPSTFGGIGLGTTTGTSLVFYTNNNNRLSINSAGDISVGATVATNTLRYFDINNQDTGVNAGADLRLITNNVAGTGPVSAEFLKLKSGLLLIKNNETNTGTGIQFVVGATTVLTMDVSGNIVAPATQAGSIRAPIFYDQNDTSYWVDPNGTSNMNSIYASGRISTGYDSQQQYAVSASNWFRSSGNTGWTNDTWGGGIYMSDSTYLRSYNNKIFYTLNDIQAKRFVDADDNTYYCDPNSTSRLNILNIIGATTSTGNISASSLTTTGNYLYLSTGTGLVNSSGGPFYYADTTNHVIKSGYGNGYLLFQNYAGNNVASINLLNGAAAFPTYYDSNNTNYYLIPSGTSILNTIQAKIYYDLDNTGYYCKPSLNSNLNTLSVQPGGISFQYGVQLYQDTTGNGPGDFAIRTYDQGGTGNYYYNVFYKNGNVSFPNQAAAGSILSYSSVSAASMQSTIYYDRDDNSYYLDPNHTSVLSYINHTGRSYYTYSGQYILGLNGAELLYYDGNTASWGYGASYNMFQKQVRAPIYYDNDDTGYYVDPNYVSNMKRAIHRPVTPSLAGSGGNGAVEIQNLGGTGDGDVAQLGFVCPGYYGVNLNLRADGYFGLGGWSSAAWRWFVSPGGDMQAAGNVTAYSDPRLKENFERVNNPLDILRVLDGGTFNWKHGFKHTETKAGKKDYGILADQVNAVMPEIVTDSIEIDGEKFKTVAYDKLVPVLIEAIKQLEARIVELEAR